MRRGSTVVTGLYKIRFRNILCFPYPHPLRIPKSKPSFIGPDIGYWLSASNTYVIMSQPPLMDQQKIMCCVPACVDMSILAWILCWFSCKFHWWFSLATRTWTKLCLFRYLFFCHFPWNVGFWSSTGPRVAADHRLKKAIARNQENI